MAATIESARPYPWPFHASFDPAQTALLIVVDDPPGGDALERVAGLAEECRRTGALTVQLSGPRSAALPFGTDVMVKRLRLSGFYATDLDLRLREERRCDLVVAGFPLELGADCTMREANDLGYECLLLEDGCSAADPDTFAGAVRSVQMSGGIFGAVATTDELLELLRRAR